MSDINSGFQDSSYSQILKFYFSVIMPGLNYNEFFNLDELNWIASILNRDEERQIKHRDQWGNWDFPFTKNDFNVPYLDKFIINRLKDRKDSGNSVWPDGKRFAFWLTHDLDVVSSGDPYSLSRKQLHLLGVSRSGTTKLKNSLYFIYNQMRKLSGYSNDNLWCYERWMEAEKSFGFNSTYFVFSRPESAGDLHEYDCDYTWNDKMKFRDRVLSVGEYICQIAEEGAEIGCHGSYLSWNNDRLLIDQRRKIEALVGKSVIASRQHFLHFDIQSTPDALRNAGFLLDSTLGFNRSIGFRAGTSYPYELIPRLIEVPQIIMDGALFNANSLDLDEALACEKVIRILDAVEEAGGCLTINFHPNYLLNKAWWNVYLFLLKELNRRNAACVNAAAIQRIFSSFSSAHSSDN